ncbi:hypothetical protein CSKR_113604 [Clonorchis sinensis]|uniref:Uncharacterized protein n=1 Tax=Clonorchis sinensis TaxID=79923 RepID=A0A419Q256_CLOSI|nr:hypothetical protein CSKR_113604 [Clonorchis sinensis]
MTLLQRPLERQKFAPENHQYAGSERLHFGGLGGHVFQSLFDHRFWVQRALRATHSSPTSHSSLENPGQLPISSTIFSTCLCMLVYALVLIYSCRVAVEMWSASTISFATIDSELLHHDSCPDHSLLFG